VSSFRAAVAASLMASYILMGTLSFQPTKRIVENACHVPPTTEMHIALWPISLISTWGLKSRC